jgi:hypothetical protein
MRHPDQVGSLTAEVEPMENVGRTILVTSLALLLLLPALPTHALLGTAPFILCSALFAACGQVQPTWVDEIEHALGTYFKKKYPASNFDPYLKVLDRVRAAVGRGDHRTEKIEMGLFLTMLAHHAQGINEEAADELSLFAQRVMPAEEYGMIFPGHELQQEERWISGRAKIAEERYDERS